MIGYEYFDFHDQALEPASWAHEEGSQAPSLSPKTWLIVAEKNVKL